ncbi:MAG: class I SAM-dependent methyltransferase [Anaerolineae bacterium]
MSDRRYDQGIERLRQPERLARLEVGRVVDLCLENLPDMRSALDVGAGSGIFAEALAARGLQVTGVDVNAEMVAAARRHLPTGRFEQAAAEALPFDARAFDLVFMGLLLHEADDALQALREARRVGRLRVAVLEWPYLEQEFGPPLAHRLPAEEIVALGEQAGIGRLEAHSLQHLVLYRADL